jgi:catechol 2,3-dioxygenase-like lactoylglutathione lyase family enzyme
MEIDYIALFVKDVYVSYVFYRDVLRFVFPKDMKKDGIEGKSGRIKIGIYHQDWYEKLFHRSFVLAQPAVLFAFTVADLDGFYQDLLNRSVNVIQPPQMMPWGQRLCFFTDPDGYIWEATAQN